LSKFADFPTMSNNYRLLFSLSIVSLIAVACGVPHPILSGSAADSAPVIMAGIKIDPPIDLSTAKRMFEKGGKGC
jgi:hypothetical protein